MCASDPVVQHTKRFIRCFWALDKDLANARHFPAVNWLENYREYLGAIDQWHRAQGDLEWHPLRDEAMSILHRESNLQQIVRLVARMRSPTRSGSSWKPPACCGRVTCNRALWIRWIPFPRQKVAAGGQEITSLAQVEGPLIMAEGGRNVAYDEMVEITAPDGRSLQGRALEAGLQEAVIQVFAGTSGLSVMGPPRRKAGAS